MRSFSLALGILAAATRIGAAESVEFTGVLASEQGMRIALRETEGGTSRWLARGEAFHGYTFKEFDPKEETVVLGKDGADIRLRLITAKVKEGGSTEKLTTAKALAIYHNLRQIYAASDQYFLEHGATSVTLDQLVGPEKYIRRLVAVADEDYSTLTLKQGVVPVLTTPSGETISADWSGSPDVTFGFYGVQQGDTGAKIARMANATLSDLAALNEGVDWARLKIGQVLRVK